MERFHSGQLMVTSLVSAYMQKKCMVQMREQVAGLESNSPSLKTEKRYENTDRMLSLSLQTTSSLNFCLLIHKMEIIPASLLHNVIMWRRWDRNRKFWFIEKLTLGVATTVLAFPLCSFKGHFPTHSLYQLDSYVFSCDHSNFHVPTQPHSTTTPMSGQRHVWPCSKW